jgi:chaperonin cofactor prefoldin
VEPWSRKEQLGWLLIGNGAIAWGIGAAWRYYTLVLHQSPFPSWADAGYAELPPLVFLGLLCLPSSNARGNQTLILLDSLIVAGSLLAIGWFLLLGSLVSTSRETPLAQALELYYPTCDIALLSCLHFIMKRTHGDFLKVRARQYGLILLGIGLAVFALSDFLFSVQQNMGTYTDGTWVDLGWPLGLLIVSIAASLRRFLPNSNTGQQTNQSEYQMLSDHSYLNHLDVFALVSLLFFVLCLNVFSTDRAQIQLRPILLIIVLIIAALLIVRQVVVIRENDLLLEQQAILLEQLAQSHYQLEAQSRRVAQHNASLEQGITHLKEVLAQLANGDMQARAYISSGDLLFLAGSLNLMAERISHTETVETYLRQLTSALNDFSSALEKRRSGKPLLLPASYRKLPEMRRLVLALGIKETPRLSSIKNPSIKTLSPPKPLSPTPQLTFEHRIYRQFTPKSARLLSPEPDFANLADRDP